MASIEWRHPIVDRPNRRREIIGRRAKVDRKPVPVANGAIASVRIGGDEEIFYVRANNVGQRQEVHFFGQMHEAVAAKQKIGPRKLVVAKIERAKFPIRTAVADACNLHKPRNDIAADVVSDGEFYLRHPVKIAARQVKKSADTEIADKFGQRLAYFFGVMEGGAATGDCFLIAPDIAPENLGKDLARSAMEIAEPSASESMSI